MTKQESRELLDRLGVGRNHSIDDIRKRYPHLPGLQAKPGK